MGTVPSEVRAQWTVPIFTRPNANTQAKVGTVPSEVRARGLSPFLRSSFARIEQERRGSVRAIFSHAPGVARTEPRPPSTRKCRLRLNDSRRRPMLLKAIGDWKGYLARDPLSRKQSRTPSLVRLLVQTLVIWVRLRARFTSATISTSPLTTRGQGQFLRKIKRCPSRYQRRRSRPNAPSRTHGTSSL